MKLSGPVLSFVGRFLIIDKSLYLLLICSGFLFPHDLVLVGFMFQGFIHFFWVVQFWHVIVHSSLL